ncbi:aldo/keto reductase [Streptomyces sp. L7]
MKGRRDDVVLATKAHLPMGEDPNRRGNSRRWLIRALEDSLRRLGTDHVDLFQIHRPDPDTDVEETLSALTDLVRAGKVRAVGTSSFPASDIVEAQWVAGAPRPGPLPHGTADVLDPQPGASNARCCRSASATAWARWSTSPLAGGQLTGRYRKGGTVDTRRAAYGFKYSRRRAPARRRGATDRPRREGGPVTDPPGHGLRDRLTPARSPRRSSAPARWPTSTTCSPARRPSSRTNSSTRSTSWSHLGTDVGTLDMAYAPPVRPANRAAQART